MTERSLKTIMVMTCVLFVFSGCKGREISQTIVEPHVSMNSIVTFEGKLKVIYNTLPGKEWVDYMALIYKVTDNLGSPIENGTEINVVITQKSVSNINAFRTKIPIGDLRIDQQCRVTVSTELPTGWDAIKDQFEWKALGLTAGLEIIAR
jgi:hypothetical protein